MELALSRSQPATAKPRCSYDAIRVYLWAGMLDPGNARPVADPPSPCTALSEHLQKVAFPGLEILPDGAFLTRGVRPVFPRR